MPPTASPTRSFLGRTTRRRGFLVLLTVAGIATAQPGRRLPRVAVVFLGSSAAEIGGADPASPYARAFVHALRDLGWVDGRNVVLERRSSEPRTDRLDAVMNEVVALGVDVIVTFGPGVGAALRATSRIPIVGIVDDALEQGLVASLSRPGRNLTGIGIDFRGFHDKRLQLLKEAAPAISRVAVIASTPLPGRPRARWRDDLDAAARSMSTEMRWLGADTPEDLELAFATIARERQNALFVGSTALNFLHVQRIAAFAFGQRLPAASQWREFCEAGGLLSHGTDELDDYRYVASYVKRILDGARPGELPFEQPTRFKLVINMRTARSFGLAIPRTLLLQADEVIE